MCNVYDEDGHQEVLCEENERQLEILIDVDEMSIE